MAAEGRRFDGRTAAEAAIKACEELGVTRSELRYDVVSDQGEGLTRRVEIAAWVDEQAGQGASSDEGGRWPAGGRSAERDRNGRSSRGGRSDRGDRGGRSDGRRGGGRGGRDGGRGQRPPRGGRRGSGELRGGGGRRRDEPPADNVEAMLNLEAVPQDPIEERPEVTGDVSAKASRSRGVVTDLLRLMEFDLTPRIVEDGDDEIHVDLVGNDEANVIGRTGDVLLSLQFLANRIVAREADGGQVVVLDAAGYRRRRRQALEELAKRLATRAKEEGKAVRLSAMSAHDRRVFHLTLSDVEGVTTRSQGDGLYRKMLIIPSDIAS